MKNVVIINDILGSMALGFSKAGYDVRALYIDFKDTENRKICMKNWGEAVKPLNEETTYEQIETDMKDLDCLAGRIYFGNSRRTLNSNNNLHGLMTIHHIMSIASPKCFVFQCLNVIDNKSIQMFCDEMGKRGYDVYVKKMDVNYITGFPVHEKPTLLIGAKNSDMLSMEMILNSDGVEYPIEKFCDNAEEVDPYYYRIQKKNAINLSSNYLSCLLCWNRDHYEEDKKVKWNIMHIPLIITGNGYRKITHREIARLKGIPEEYWLEITNRTSLYSKLYSSSNVKLIQRVASSLCLTATDTYEYKREVRKGLKFEEIMFSYFREKGYANAIDLKNTDSYVDYQCETTQGKFGFEFKFYSSNQLAERRIILLCEKLSVLDSLKDSEVAIIVANIVREEIKSRIKKDYNISVWDVENILWMLEDYPSLITDFKALLSFNSFNIIPKVPNHAFFGTNEPKLICEKIDFQERLRNVKAGKEEAREYEILCTEIIKFLFGDAIEFYDPQKVSNDGLFRFDLCGKIKHGSSGEFYENILRFFDTKYIVFEYKNYEKEITQKEIYTTEKYLYEKALRKVAIILSRKGMDKNAMKAARGSLREMGKIILCLSDEDVNKMIDIKNQDLDPADYLEQMLDAVLMDLEK